MHERMTNEEVVEQIGKVVEAKLEAEREHTRKLIHEEIAAAKKLQPLRKKPFMCFQK
jgi:hypothetical protein